MYSTRLTIGLFCFNVRSYSLRVSSCFLIVSLPLCFNYSCSYFQAPTTTTNYALLVQTYVHTYCTRLWMLLGLHSFWHTTGVILILYVQYINFRHESGFICNQQYMVYEHEQGCTRNFVWRGRSNLFTLWKLILSMCLFCCTIVHKPLL